MENTYTRANMEWGWEAHDVLTLHKELQANWERWEWETSSPSPPGKSTPIGYPILRGQPRNIPASIACTDNTVK